MTNIEIAEQIIYGSRKGLSLPELMAEALSQAEQRGRDLQNEEDATTSSNHDCHRFCHDPYTEDESVYCGKTIASDIRALRKGKV